MLNYSVAELRVKMNFIKNLQCLRFFFYPLQGIFILLITICNENLLHCKMFQKIKSASLFLYILLLYKNTTNIQIQYLFTKIVKTITYYKI